MWTWTPITWPPGAWRLDVHGNPTGTPRRFFYDLTATAHHRDAEIRHALTRLLHLALTCGVQAIAVEDLDFGAEKTREKHGRRKRFRQLISGMPTGKLRARLASMADTTGVAVIAVDTPPRPLRHWGRTTPPPAHRRDEQGHRTVQARPEVPGREEPRPRIPGPRTRSVGPGCGVNAGNQNAQHRPGRSAEHETWQQDSLPLSP